MATSGTLIPSNTPYSYNIGINYETWGRASNAADLSALSQYFSLIRTYHDMSVGTANPSIPQIDPTEQNVFSYLVSSESTQPKQTIQLSMGTNSSAVAQGGFGNPWAPGLMTSSTYTDAWVKQVLTAFGDTIGQNPTHTILHLKSIILGNELDQNGPPSGDPAFSSYQGWIESSLSNLATSLSKYGLGSIPVTTSIANYPAVATSNPIAANTVQYIQTNWNPNWNAGTPFVAFDQYTQNDQSSTNFDYVTNYFNGLTSLSVQPFVGETGETSFSGSANGFKYQGSVGQQTVYDAINAWLATQNNPTPGTPNGKTIPMFLFQAFNTSNADPAQAHDGVFVDSVTGGPPTGALKPGVTLPTWTNIAIGQKVPASTSSTNDYQVVYNLYQAAFNREPDVEGINHWVNQLATKSLSSNQLSKLFINSAEGQTSIGYSPSPDHLITSVYANALGRTVDADGQKYWTDQLSNGMTADQFLLATATSTEAVKYIGISQHLANI